MKTNIIFSIIFIFLSLSLINLINTSIDTESNSVVHFLKCGSADSILIESNGKFGLIDSSNPYKNIENEVEPAEIDGSKGEVNQWSSLADESVQAVLNYLEYLKVNKLDFIIGTHAHSDHIGGIPAIAYKYVDSNTKYYYREYRETREDTTNIDWANYKYYLAAVHSMEKKGAELIDVTDKIINFDFGDMNLELLNTDIDPNELKYGENQNSIVTLLKHGNTKVFLAADMIYQDDIKIKDYIGKIDILKLAHHGYSESSYDFLSTTKPDYVIISNNHIPAYSNKIINYLKESLDSKIYLTNNIPGTTEIVDKSAIKLYFTNDSKKFTLSNTGNEVNVKITDNGWITWCEKWLYFKEGNSLKGWQKLDWSQGKDWFYFNSDGIMLTGWQRLDWSQGNDWFYFNHDGVMLTGWRNLLWSGGRNTFYFMPDSGRMLSNICVDIDGKNYCFDENGCLI